MKPGIRTGWILSLIALILTALACNWADLVPPAAPVIEPSPLPTFAIPTLTPIPTETALPTPTSTPGAPIALPKALGVNCRYGPGQGWDVVHSIPEGTSIEIKGRTVDTSWWYVRDPLQINEGFCWVAYEAVETAGNLNIVPIVEPPAASVTQVTVDTVLVTFDTCGGSNQVTLNGSITTNGPGTVNYHWEVSGAAQETTPQTALEFDRSGSQNVNTTVSLAECGEYSATLRVTAPSELSAQKGFSLQSP